MSSINTSKVVTAGLLAGLVFNAIDFVINGIIVNAEMMANMTRLGLDASAMESVPSMVTWIAVDFLLGILVVFTYAAIRPRFGPGPRTAVYAGLMLFLPITVVMYGLSTGGILTMSLFAKTSALSLVNVIVGSIVGAWAYKEA